MKYRTVGNTDLSVSEIGFGCWTVGTDWWAKLNEEKAVQLLKRSFELGINFFDTADAYGDGLSERLLALALKGRRDQMVIATKFGYDFYSETKRKGHKERPQNFTPSYIRLALEKSLGRLETSYVDLYQLHNPRLDIILDDPVFETLEELRKEGKIRYYGVALGPAIGWLEEGKAAIKRRKVASVQTVYNILEQDPGRELIMVAKEHNASVLARVTHASGLLDGKFNEGTAFLGGDHRSYRRRDWLVEGLKKVEKLRFVTEGRGRTLAQAALKFVLADRAVASALPTITTIEELEEYAKASEVEEVSPEELERIADLYAHNFYLGE